MKFANSSQLSGDKLDDPRRAEDIGIDNSDYGLDDKPPTKAKAGWGRLFDKKGKNVNFDIKADSSKTSESISDFSSSAKDVVEDPGVDRPHVQPLGRRKSGWGNLMNKNSRYESGPIETNSSGLEADVSSSAKDVVEDPGVDRPHAQPIAKRKSGWGNLMNKRSKYESGPIETSSSGRTVDVSSSAKDFSEDPFVDRTRSAYS